MNFNGFLKNICVMVAGSEEIGISMENRARTGLHEINLASRKAEEAGQSFSIYSYVDVSVWVLEMLKWKERDRKVSKFVMFSVVSGFQEKNNNPLQLSGVVGFC